MKNKEYFVGFFSFFICILLISIILVPVGCTSPPMCAPGENDGTIECDEEESNESKEGESPDEEPENENNEEDENDEQGNDEEDEDEKTDEEDEYEFPPVDLLPEEPEECDMPSNWRGDPDPDYRITPMGIWHWFNDWYEDRIPIRYYGGPES